MDNLLLDLFSRVTTRSRIKNHCAFNEFISMVETKKITEAINDAYWIIAMEEELN